MRRILVIALAALSLQSAGAYAASGDTMNFRFSPVGLVIGAVGLNLDFAVHEQWTIGPDVLYWRLKFDGLFTNTEITVYTVGARANWFKNGVFTDGFYIGPSIGYASAKAEYTDVDGTIGTESASAPFGQVLFGYGWFWDSFNMMLGGGAQALLGNGEVEVVENGETRKRKINRGGLALEFSLGWTF